MNDKTEFSDAQLQGLRDHITKERRNAENYIDKELSEIKQQIEDVRQELKTDIADVKEDVETIASVNGIVLPSKNKQPNRR